MGSYFNAGGLRQRTSVKTTKTSDPHRFGSKRLTRSNCCFCHWNRYVRRPSNAVPAAGQCCAQGE